MGFFVTETRYETIPLLGRKPAGLARKSDALHCRGGGRGPFGLVASMLEAARERPERPLLRPARPKGGGGPLCARSRRIGSFSRERIMQNNEFYEDGRNKELLREHARTRDMLAPVRCAHCSRIYDLCKTTVTARYADATCFVSPCCKRSVDDRGWKSMPDFYKIDL